MENLAKIFRPITTPQQIEEILKEFTDLHKQTGNDATLKAAQDALLQIITESIKEKLAGRIGDATLSELIDLHKQIGLINKPTHINNSTSQGNHGRRHKG